MEIKIDDSILNYAERTYRHLVPLQRKSGFNEIKGQERGSGDLCDLVGTLVVFDLLGQSNIVSSMDITSGRGDDKDLTIWIRQEGLAWNIKTSRYAPFREGLNLFIKEEEISKPMYGWIQVFVHLEENGLHPHVHIAGFTTRKTKAWKDNSEIIEIPRTNGHRGVGIPIGELLPFTALIENADKKF